MLPIVVVLERWLIVARTHVVVIGVGSIGERHLRCFGRTDRVDLSICETNETVRNEIARRYAVKHVFEDLEAVARARPDAAVICTPAPLHVPMAIALARVGTHLLVEKPLSTSDDGVERLFELAREKNITIAVGYTMRMNPLLAEVREAISEKRFGKVVQVSTVSGQHFPTYRPAYRDIYYADRATGGGAIQDALTHQINAAEWLVGPVTRVAADAAHQVLDGVEVEDTVHVIARHGSVQSSFSLNQHQAPNETTMNIVCQTGTMQIEFHRQRWRWQTEPDQVWQLGSQISLERDDLFVSQATMFLNAMESKSPVACSLEEGLQTLYAILALLRAADSQSWQDVRSGIRNP